MGKRKNRDKKTDPVENLPPETNLNNSEDPGHLHSLSASQEELDIDKPSESRVGHLGPLEPHQAWVDEAASHRASTAGAQSDTDILCWTQNEPNLNQQTSTNTQPWIQPHVSPFPFNPQALPPGLWVQPQLIMVPCCVLPPVASTPESRFGFIASVLVPYNPIPLPRSCFPLFEVDPRWCQCSPTAHIHQSREPSLMVGELASESLNVTQQSVGTEKCEKEEKSEEKQKNNDKPDQDKRQSNNTGNETKKSMVSPGPSLSLDEESLAEHAFEEYMTIMDLLCPDEMHKNMEVKEKEDEEDKDGTKEKLETKNNTFLEYLDELCGDKDFVRKAESMLNIEFLESLLSSNPEMPKLSVLETQEQELEQSQQPSPSPDSDPVTDGTSLALAVTLQKQSHQPPTDSISDPADPPEGGAQTPVMDPPNSNPKKDKQKASLGTDPKEGQLLTDDTPGYLNTLSCPCHDGSVAYDDELARPLPGDPKSPSTSGVTGSTEDPPAPHFRVNWLPDTPPQAAGPPALRVLAKKALPPEDRYCPAEPFTLKDMSHPVIDDLDAIPVPPSSSFESHPDSSDAQADGNSSAPEEQISASPKGPPNSQELVSPHVISESLTREWCVIEKKCENILEEGAKTSETPGKTERKARDERKQENKEKDTRLFVKVRRSQRLTRQNEKEKAGKSIKKTLTFTPENDGVIYEKQTRRFSGARQLCKREESNFKEQSQGTKITQTVEQFSEMAKKDRHQRLTGEVQRLVVEAGEPCQAGDSKERKEKENSLSKTTPREKSEKDEGSAKRKQERRKAQSKTTEEELERTLLFVAEDGRKGHQSEMKATPQRKTQGKVEECSDQESISSPVKRSKTRRNKKERSEKTKAKNKDLTTHEARQVSTNLSPVSTPISSGLQIDTPPTTDKTIDQGNWRASGEVPVNKTEKHQKQSPGSHSESKHHSSSPKPSPDKASGVKGEGEDVEQPNLPPSQMKRRLKTEKVEIKTDILQSPTKRPRLKIKVEVNSGRAEDQSETRTAKGNNDGSVDICSLRTSRKTKAKDKMTSNPSNPSLTRQETSGEE